MPRFFRLLPLVALAASASAQPLVGSAADRLAHAPVAVLPTSFELSAGPAPSAAPAALESEVTVPLVASEGGLIATVVDEPAPVEDPVQLRAARAPVRMELAQARRRVVLLPGVAAREPEPAEALVFESPSDAASTERVVYSRAVVVVGEGGRREVRYVDAKSSPLDVGASVGCGAGTLELGLRLRGVRSSPLRLGMQGEAVRAAQYLLCAAGYEVGTDGVFDRDVDRAVRQFQRDHNASGRGRQLSVDGAFGYRTRQALEAAVAAR